jgi:beta-galactosidase
VAAAAARGAVVLVTYLSGIVDETNRVRAGGYPGAFRDMLGVFGEEFFTVQDGETITLRGDADGRNWLANTWSEKVHADDSETVAWYETGQLAGSSAITRRLLGAGQAWYVSTRLDQDGIDALVGRLLDAAGVRASVPVVPGLEAVRRVADTHSYLFLLNHSGASITVDVGGFDLVSGEELTQGVTVAAGAVRVLRESRPSGEALR